MERIKDLSKITLRPDMVLAKLHEINTGSIIVPGTTQNKGGFDHLEVIKVGSTVEDLKPGDIIFDIDGSAASYEIGGTVYVRMPRYNVIISTTPDNFINIPKKFAPVKDPKLVN